MHTRVVTALAMLAALGTTAGCDPGEKEPAGFTRLGTVDDVVVYGRLTSGGARLSIRMMAPDGVPLCDGGGGLSTQKPTEICNDTANGMSVVAIATPKGRRAPNICDIASGVQRSVSELRTPRRWPVDVAASVASNVTTTVTTCEGTKN